MYDKPMRVRWILLTFCLFMAVLMYLNHSIGLAVFHVSYGLLLFAVARKLTNTDNGNPTDL